MIRPATVAPPAALPLSLPLPWRPVEPIARADFARFRRRAIFECCKWDPQVGDAATLADHPLVLEPEAWDDLAALAERLAAELAAAEREMLGDPALLRPLGLPRRIMGMLAARDGGAPSAGIARVVRFDFHFTPDGWRISEANTDVPGGMNEASGFARLLAPHYPDALAVGDPAAAYASAVAASVPPGGVVALVHATAYSDDRQVMEYVQRRLADLGVAACLASPTHLRWRRGRARVTSDWMDAEAAAIVRFFPGEWLPNLEGEAEWLPFFRGGRTPLSNPAGALVTQSKRFPLVWDALRTALPTWRALLPETRDPREVPWTKRDEWVLKPAFGRVGEDIALPGVSSDADWKRLARAARADPGQWVAQRRFETVPMRLADAVLHPCVGVYTIDGVAAGAYGRLATRPLIDGTARDAAVLRARREPAAAPAAPSPDER